jgi:hypothetical protein
MSLLGQTEDLGRVFVLSAGLLLLCVALFFVASVVRKKLRDSADDVSGGGFTLNDLRELHRSGKMSDDEFERAKAALVDATRAAAARAAPPAPPRGRDSSTPGAG